MKDFEKVYVPVKVIEHVRDEEIKMELSKFYQCGACKAVSPMHAFKDAKLHIPGAPLKVCPHCQTTLRMETL